MIELPLIFVSGILGSGHCLGMCGPFVLSIGGAATSRPQAVIRQLSFTAGRLATYGFLGAIAAAAGLWLGKISSSLIFASGILAVVAGAFLIFQGLVAAGLILPRAWAKSVAGCAAARAYSSLLTAPGAGPPFFAGLLTGFLPCGLLYGFVAIAAATHHVFLGWLVMIVFGLGTAPALMVAGWTSSAASVAFRQRLLRIAAWCVILTGLVAVSRGVSALAMSSKNSGEAAQACPFCSGEHTAHGDRQEGSMNSH